MRPLNIGLIGYGGIGRVHALAYRAIPFHYGLPAELINITGIATSRRESAEQAASETGCSFATDDYRELLSRGDIDLIDCCAPNYMHHEILLAAAQSGKHIYCEKPLAMNVIEGQEIANAVAAAGVKSQMTFNFRFFPAIIRARQLIEEGFLGRVFSFWGRYYRSSYISAERPISWRLRKEKSGGGALFDLGSHVLDLIYYLLGDFGSAQATLDTLIPERPIAPGASQMAIVDVDDIALLHLRMADNTPGSVEISRMGTGATNDLRIEIIGDRGALRFRSEDPSWLEAYDTRDGEQPLGGMRGFRKIQTAQRYPGAKAPDWSMTPSFTRTHVECQYQFLKAIWEDRDAAPSISDGQHIQEVMEAAIRSSITGRRVSLAEVQNSA